MREQISKYINFTRKKRMSKDFMEKPWPNWPKGVPYTIDYPNVALFALLDETARNYPDQVALIFQDKKLTYRVLKNQVDRVATGLQELGVGKGDRVALSLPNIPQFVISYYGALKAGAIVTAIDPLFKETEVKHQLNDSESETLIVLDRFYSCIREIKSETALKRVIVTSVKEYLPTIKRVLGSLLGKVPSQKVDPEPGIHFFQDLLNKYKPAPREIAIDPKEDLALLQYTGGTTGTPKGAMITHYNLVSNAYMCNAWLGSEKGKERYLNVLPLYHIYGMTVTMNSAIALAGTMILIPRFNAVEVLEAIQKHRASNFCGVPTIYQVLINHPQISRFDLSSVRFCISGASPLPPEVQRKFMDLTGGVLVEGYGLTEASPVTHANPLDPTLETVKTGSIGFTWPDTKAKIVLGSSGGEQPVGEAGELAVMGPQVMKGYWKMPQETAKVLKDGWLYTGDMAKQDDEGYFYIVDRKKDLIKYKGYSVFPREIEQVLHQHPAVKKCAIIGIPNPLSGEIPKAFVVLEKGAKATEEGLLQFVQERVAPYKRIRKVEFREELPTSSAGKVLKRRLRQSQP